MDRLIDMVIDDSFLLRREIALIVHL